MQKTIEIQNSEITARLFGSYDKNASRVEEAFGVRISNRQSVNDIGDTILIDGEEGAVRQAADCLNYLRRIASLGNDITDQNVDYIIGMVKDGKMEELAAFDEDCFLVTVKGKPIKAKTIGQKRYVDAIRKNSVVLGIGPAGTGKTYLAVAMAVKALKNHEVSRIILTRPAVEAGERLGFLPGDLQSK
ncbi:MAG: PhoH family protein, partial [Clostridia bacterium]|nr:PhoH family protein [Clostridia bacterium]